MELIYGVRLDKHFVTQLSRCLITSGGVKGSKDVFLRISFLILPCPLTSIFFVRLSNLRVPVLHTESFFLLTHKLFVTFMPSHLYAPSSYIVLSTEFRLGARIPPPSGVPPPCGSMSPTLCPKMEFLSLWKNGTRRMEANLEGWRDWWGYTPPSPIKKLHRHPQLSQQKWAEFAIKNCVKLILRCGNNGDKIESAWRLIISPPGEISRKYICGNCESRTNPGICLKIKVSQIHCALPQILFPPRCISVCPSPPGDGRGLPPGSVAPLGSPMGTAATKTKPTQLWYVPIGIGEPHPSYKFSGVKLICAVCSVQNTIFLREHLWELSPPKALL